MSASGKTHLGPLQMTTPSEPQPSGLPGGKYLSSWRLEPQLGFDSGRRQHRGPEHNVCYGGSAPEVPWEMRDVRLPSSRTR
jgi:hypothetical protein